MGAEHGINLLSMAVGSGVENLASAAIVGSVLTYSGFLAVRAMRAASSPIIPDETLTTRNLFEIFSEGLLKMSDDAMGRENRKYLPFVATLFCYLFFMNLMGLVPGFSPATDNFAFNIGMALLVFVLYNYWGVREQGLGSYLKHMWGPVWWLGVLLFPVELMGHAFRPLTLSIRLFGNMTADHRILEEFTNLTYFAVPLIFYAFGTFVCFMQAFIFTVLTMVYIRLAVTHEHHDHEGEHH